jgi:hypothetical protein
MALPKYGGRDSELSTTGVDGCGQAMDAWQVSREILARLPAALQPRGVKVWSHPAWQRGYGSPHSADCLRQWTSGGQCYYCDMSHVECCTAATKHPLTFAAQSVSTLLAIESARRLAEQESAADVTYALTTANADMLDPAISFGTHISIQTSRDLWEDLLEDSRHPAILGFVTSALAAAVPFFGAGHILPLKDGRAIYSLSARAHHLTKIKTYSTTQPFGRGLLNCRREPHGLDHERLHLICFDFCMLAAAPMFSFLQCMLAAAEEGYCGMNLYDPLRALRAWSWCTDLNTGRLPAAATLVDGRRLTLPAYVSELATILLRMCERKLITPEVAPQATEMLPRIIDLAGYAAEGALLRCSRQLGWASKLLWLIQLCDQRGAALSDPAIRLADHDFGHTDPRRGTVWQLWEQGLVDPLVDRAAAERCLVSGPAESRDWGRGRIVDKFHESVADIDWSFVDLRSAEGRWSPRLRIDLPYLDSLNRAGFEPLIEAADDPLQLSQRLAGARSGGASRPTDRRDDVAHPAVPVTPRGIPPAEHER